MFNLIASVVGVVVGVTVGILVKDRVVEFVAVSLDQGLARVKGERLSEKQEHVERMTAFGVRSRLES